MNIKSFIPKEYDISIVFSGFNGFKIYFYIGSDNYELELQRADVLCDLLEEKTGHQWVKSDIDETYKIIDIITVSLLLRDSYREGRFDAGLDRNGNGNSLEESLI